MGKSNIAQTLPASMAVLAISASLCYFVMKDYRRAIYWAAVAVITLVVTF